MSTPGHPGCVPITCQDGLDHLVPETMVARATDGRYTAMCHSVVLPAALLAPPAQRCPLCWAWAPAAPSLGGGTSCRPWARRLRSIHRPAPTVGGPDDLDPPD